MTERVGGFVVDRYAARRRAAQTIRRIGGVPAGTVPELRQATVVSNDGGTPPSCTIQTGGSATVEAGIRFAAGVNPQAGDLVYVVSLSGDKWVLTKLAGGAYAAVDYWSIGGATGTTAAASNVTVATAASSLVKVSAGTRVKLDLRASAFATVASTEVTWAVGLSGTDYDVFSLWYNAASAHGGNSGIRHVTGVAAGTYTVTLRWRRTSGTGTLTRDVNDTLSATVEEVP